VASAVPKEGGEISRWDGNLWGEDRSSAVGQDVRSRNSYVFARKDQ
jgi:hypothetical protein